MKFVETHLTGEHFRRHPHRWFLALLLSPIHAGEMHYERRYHMNFIHAKKVFFFDLALVLSTFVLLGATITWFTYDPTVERHVAFTIAADTHRIDGSDRIRSGEHVTYTLSYKNKSNVPLTDGSITWNLPKGFVVETGDKKVPVATLLPGEEGTVHITGFFFEDTDSTHHVSGAYTYRQKDGWITEEKVATIIQTLRGSVVTGTFSGPTHIVDGSTYPISITLKNENHHPVGPVVLPFDGQKEFSMSGGVSSDGTITPTKWQIDTLAPDQVVTLTATLAVHVSDRENTKTLSFVPLIVTPTTNAKQTALTLPMTVLRPEVSVSSRWEEAIGEPGAESHLVVTVANRGTIQLLSPTVSFEIPDTIDITKLTKANGGKVAGDMFTLPLGASLDPGVSQNMSLTIPILSRIQNGSERTLVISPIISAVLAGDSRTPFSIQKDATPELPISTNVFLGGEVRYYTDEGDQLGRGPLPPLVGQETKYWALLTVENTTSRFLDLSFTATLPPHVTWTGKSSVDHGKELTLDQGAHSLSWKLNVLPAHHTAGIYVELALTPTENDRGKTPLLLSNIRVVGTDAITNEIITRTTQDLDVSLAHDEIGREQGAIVQ